jgi:hypothetical protein
MCLCCAAVYKGELRMEKRFDGSMGQDNVLFVHLTKGSFFGEEALLPDWKPTQNTEILAESMCVLYTLSSTHFHSVLENFPDHRHFLNVRESFPLLPHLSCPALGFPRARFQAVLSPLSVSCAVSLWHPSSLQRAPLWKLMTLMVIVCMRRDDNRAVVRSKEEVRGPPAQPYLDELVAERAVQLLVGTTVCRASLAHAAQFPSARMQHSDTV